MIAMYRSLRRRGWQPIQAATIITGNVLILTIGLAFAGAEFIDGWDQALSYLREAH
ncbi:hypothetical protein OPKNFCMD_5278 [Methylobacterium crusticola]|uniref:Uncharacterized protein n=1 Tax=Methylobacterium crusticola TaxID=1697972 RepID=A0ABQ4R4C7_9HYPH|nr:hypothetical protein [Methylobacterium crusticola]GJD52512.1 hypothetical protein OPKNFCMD_5278 [Methylobacterium crusticola]